MSYNGEFIHPDGISSTNYDGDNQSAEYDGKLLKFFEILRMVLPQKVEEAYVNLSKSVEEYFNTKNHSTFNDLTKQDINTEIDRSLTSLIRLKDEEKELKELLSEINEAITKGTSNAVYHQLVTVSEKLLENKTKIENIEKKINQNEVEYDKRKDQSSELEGSVSSSIDSLSSSLQNISDLDIDGKKRLDGIEITKKHLDMIDSMEAKPEEKEMFKALLSSYVNMRLECFRNIENTANAVLINKNNDHPELLSEQRMADCELSLIALSQVRLDVRYFTGNQIHLDSIPRYLDTMNIVSEHLRGNVASREQVDKIFNNDHPLDYSFQTILMSLMNNPSVIEAEQNKGISM